jgi:formylglycine-generating enzyme required for sulfatase activity
MQSSRTPKATIQKRSASNQFYEETLAEKVQLRMMLIPAGEFQMGSPGNELERSDSEGPQHLVSVSSFFLGKYPVTQAQWRIVAQIPIVERNLDPDPSHFKGDARPVEKVSWNEAIEFCARLSEHTQRQYRLPSEAEWEYACRAGTTSAFHFGEIISPELANYNSSSAYGGGPTGIYRAETTTVDRFEVANAWGLCDMHGNVFEWCQDHWHEDYNEAPKDGSAWLLKSANKLSALRGGSRASYRYEAPRGIDRQVVRGGSWNNNSRDCRSAYRLRNDPGDHNDALGFRVSCSTPQSLRSTAEPV